MQQISVIKRPLSEKEIDLLTKEIAKFPHPAYFSKTDWQGADCIYLISFNNSLAGVCVAYNLGQWIKLGPLVILKKYQGRGLGKILLNKITKDYLNKNIYIGSHNPIVGRIVEKMGYKKRSITSFMKLPKELIGYYFKFFLGRMNITCISEIIRKKFKFNDKNKYYFYFKYV